MHTALRLLLLTLTALLLQAVPSLAQAKEGATRHATVPRVLQADASAAKPCEARAALLTAWEEFEFATADATLLGMPSDEERGEMQAPRWEMASHLLADQTRPHWVMAWLPHPWLPGRLRPPIAAAT